MTTVAREAQAERVATMLNAIAEPHRLLILRHLRRGARSAGYLAEATGMSASLTSHHLNVLSDAGLVHRQKKGQFGCYSVDASKLRGTYDQLGRLVGMVGAVADSRSVKVIDPC